MYNCTRLGKKKENTRIQEAGSLCMKIHSSWTCTSITPNPHPTHPPPMDEALLFSQPKVSWKITLPFSHPFILSIDILLTELHSNILCLESNLHVYVQVYKIMSQTDLAVFYCDTSPSDTGWFFYHVFFFLLKHLAPWSRIENISPTLFNH